MPDDCCSKNCCKAIGFIPGIGKKTESIFRDFDCKTVEDVNKFDVFDLNKMFGKKTGVPSLKI